MYDVDMFEENQEAHHSERQWVRSLVPRIQKEFEASNTSTASVEVCDGKKLAYTYEIHEYAGEKSIKPSSAHYETDLLIYDKLETGNWVPRVVVECKMGGVNTHDPLTYSTKASTHKHVHPYLRYGFLVGGIRGIPGRLIKHGAYFDFMATWFSLEPSPEKWIRFIEVLKEEVIASRTIQEILTTTRSASKKRYNILHRPLKLWNTH